MTPTPEQVEAIEDYLRTLDHLEETCRDSLRTAASTLKRGDAADDAFIQMLHELRPVVDGSGRTVLIVPPEGDRGLQVAERAERSAPVEVSSVVHAADEAIKALGKAFAGNENVSAGDEIAGYPVSEHVRAVANAHRHCRGWKVLADAAYGGDAKAYKSLDDNWNQPRLKMLLGASGWVSEPCGIALVARLSDVEVNSREFDADKVLERLRSVARVLCSTAFGSTEPYDDAMQCIADEKAYGDMDISPGRDS